MSRFSFKHFLGVVPGLALVGLLAAVPSSAQDAKPQPEKGFRVTYLLFSGRPNPSVVVTEPGQVAEIAQQLAGTLAGGARRDAAASHPVLGYNGIMIQRLGASKGEGWFVVNRDTLRVEGGDAQVPASETGGAKSLAAFSRSTLAVSREAEEIEDLLISLGMNAGVIDEAGQSVLYSPPE
ncbi:MAG TPA: hypothetical protein VEL74_07885 [Thermoanaerobaculia bacterium]|nr:hypothetical protein [Thermoanaerobaculia bacterium]